MIILRRPEMTDERINEIRQIIEENPTWHRTQISQHICKKWRWQNPNGTLKDISCRDMLRDLDNAGKIELPPPRYVRRKKGEIIKIKHLKHDTTPIDTSLSTLQPLEIETLGAGEKLDAFKSYLDQYHYLGFDRTVGENIKYMVYSRDGQPLSCLLFGSAAWSCSARDEFIGWDKTQRRQGLSNMTSNTRFLVFPWVKVPHLASHVLSLIARRINLDWQEKYGHKIYCLETFVERERFKGTVYRASNWICVGETTGRGRDGGHQHAILPIKDIYLYPLVRNFRAALKNP